MAPSPAERLLKADYPTPFDTIFANYVLVRRFSEEVYLDFCTASPETIEGKELNPNDPIPAVAKVRIVLTPEHAKRLGKVLLAANPESGVPTISPPQ